MVNLLIRILAKIGVLQNLNLYPVVTINGHKVRVPIIMGLGRVNIYMPEIWMCTMIKALLSVKDGIFIDIGVNVGQTLIKLRTVNSQVNYIGFEPNPSCVFYVNDLIKMNNYKNTTIFPVGISENDQLIELNFFADEAIDPSASMIKSFRPNAKVFKKEFIPCFSFKAILKELQVEKVSIIKIDVEGAEAEVIKSISGFVAVQRPFILIEILPVYSPENTSRLDAQLEIEKYLKANEYKIFRIHKTASDTFSSLEILENIGIHSTMAWCDYLLCPQEKSIEAMNKFEQITS